jgi:hypothetical protein
VSGRGQQFAKSPTAIEKIGGAEGDRTPDPQTARAISHFLKHLKSRRVRDLRLPLNLSIRAHSCRSPPSSPPTLAGKALKPLGEESRYRGYTHKQVDQLGEWLAVARFQVGRGGRGRGDAEWCGCRGVEAPPQALTAAVPSRTVRPQFRKPPTALRPLNTRCSHGRESTSGVL